MPILGFSVLKDKLLDRTKCQTIRVPRKRPFKVGDHLYIYWHLRQRDCEKLGEGIITNIRKKMFFNLDCHDGVLDGFAEEDQKGFNGHAYWKLQQALKRMHPEINDSTKLDIITWKWE